MNAKRTVLAPNGVRLGSLLWIIVFIAIFAATGIIYGLLKNHQIKVVRQIEEVRREIVMFQNDANLAQIKIDEQLGHFEIKSKLAAVQSPLKPLANGQVETINEALLQRSRSLAAAGMRSRN